MSRIRFLFFLALAVIAGVGMGFVVRNNLADRRIEALESSRVEFRDRVIQGMNSIRIGDQLQNAAFDQLNGASIHLADLVKGRTVISVIDIECATCIEEIRLVANISNDDMGETQFLFITSSGEAALEGLVPYFRENRKCVIDRGGSWQRQMRIENYPFIMVVDKDRRILEIETTGLSSEQLRKLLAAK